MYGSTKGTKTCFEVGQCFEVQTQDQHVCHMPRLRGGEMFETPTEHSWSDHELTACGIMNMEEKPLMAIDSDTFVDCRQRQHELKASTEILQSTAGEPS
jgi:hypothetical protein